MLRATCGDGGAGGMARAAWQLAAGRRVRLRNPLVVHTGAGGRIPTLECVTKFASSSGRAGCRRGVEARGAGAPCSRRRKRRARPQCRQAQRSMHVCNWAQSRVHPTDSKLRFAHCVLFRRRPRSPPNTSSASKAAAHLNRFCLIFCFSSASGPATLGGSLTSCLQRGAAGGAMGGRRRCERCKRRLALQHTAGPGSQQPLQGPS